MRYRAKLYWRIPGGELQYGTLSHSLHLWFRGKCYRLWRGKR